MAGITKGAHMPKNMQQRIPTVSADLGARYPFWVALIVTIAVALGAA
jgi:hypothetical protein